MTVQHGDDPFGPSTILSTLRSHSSADIRVLSAGGSNIEQLLALLKLIDNKKSKESAGSGLNYHVHSDELMRLMN